ncbi:hypothetical protein Tco_0653243 [Tanacetum coccineum]|uniref:Uncharacterized protein n=1 Tax=Tanacetum coccineum TaxID=301880 RepID=A0ABQ4WZX3_9ASTR
MLQARENLMETIQAFLREYDHIPSEEKYMALLLVEERFLKIKQVVEEEQNQPEAEQEEQAAKSSTPYGKFSMIDDMKVLQDRENLMKEIYTFLRKFSRISFGEMPKVLLVVWERFSEIKHAFTDKHYQQEDIQELMSKLLEDDDDDEYCISNRKPKEITPDLPIEEPDNSLNICDVLSCDHFDAECGLINSLLSRDSSITSSKIDFLPEEFDEDEILHEKLINVNLLVDKIEALKLTPFIPFVLENPSFSPIPVVDSDFLVEEANTFLVSEDSIPPCIESDLDSEGDILFLDNLLNDDPIPDYERFTFDIEPDAPVINNFDVLNEDECFDPWGGKINVSQNVKDDDSFTFVIRTFLPYRTYHADSPLLLSIGSEDTIFDPDIST